MLALWPLLPNCSHSTSAWPVSVCSQDYTTRRQELLHPAHARRPGLPTGCVARNHWQTRVWLWPAVLSRTHAHRQHSCCPALTLSSRLHCHLPASSASSRTTGPSDDASHKRQTKPHGPTCSVNINNNRLIHDRRAFIGSGLHTLWTIVHATVLVEEFPFCLVHPMRHTPPLN